MKERPILFNGEMVRAILDGRKTQTRRVVKSQPNRTQILSRDAAAPSGYSWISPEYDDELLACPYGQPGDRLWVRETFAAQWRDDAFGIQYKADDSWLERKCPPIENSRWYRQFCPSIHMPRWASRITLEIVSVRVERLQDITDGDAVREGVGTAIDRISSNFPGKWINEFRHLWDSINAKSHPWDSNPWVWAIEFKRV